MTHVTCRLTAKNRDRLRNPTLGNQVWANFTFLADYCCSYDGAQFTFCVVAVVDEMKSSGIDCHHCQTACSQSSDAAAAAAVYTWLYSFSRLTTSSVAPATGCGVCVGAVVNDSRLAAMATDRCQARGAGARLCPRGAASDRAIAARFADAVDAASSAAARLRAGIDRARTDLTDRVRDLRRRLAFHARVGLAGVRASFVDGFATAFDVVRERSLSPLVDDGGYDTVAHLERSVKQLTFISLSETVARQVRVRSARCCIDPAAT